jgi:hypothetical protein
MAGRVVSEWAICIANRHGVVPQVVEKLALDAVLRFNYCSLDLFDNPVGYRTSLPKNADFLAKSTFFVVFQRKLFRN